MAKQKNKKRRFTIKELSGEWPAFLAQLQEEADRGAILVAAAFLSDSLGAMLRAVLLEESQTAGEEQRIAEKILKGNLRHMAPRTDITYALGLIGPEANKNLNTIREMRNIAAHTYQAAAFSDVTIQEKCRELQLPRGCPIPANQTPRDHFLLTVAFVIMELRGCAFRLKHARSPKDATFALAVKMADKVKPQTDPPPARPETGAR